MFIFVYNFYIYFLLFMILIVNFKRKDIQRSFLTFKDPEGKSAGDFINIFVDFWQTIFQKQYSYFSIKPKFRIWIRYTVQAGVLDLHDEDPDGDPDLQLRRQDFRYHYNICHIYNLSQYST